MYIKVFSYCSCIVEVLIDKEDFKGRSLSLAPARRRSGATLSNGGNLNYI